MSERTQTPTTTDPSHEQPHVVDREAAQEKFEEFLAELGLDPSDDEHLADTPRRVVDSRVDELFRGLAEDPARHLETTFSDVEQYQGDAGWVIVQDIAVKSTCAHHLLPFRGVAHVGYIPQDDVVGLSKLSRVVDGFARRPQVQERLTNQVATAVHEHLNPLAVVVVIEAEHECMSLRGVQESDAYTTTSAVRGQARTNPSIKQEFMSLIDSSRWSP